MRDFAQDAVVNAEHGHRTQELVERLKPYLGIESPSRHYVTDPTNYFYKLFKPLDVSKFPGHPLKPISHF